MTDSVSNQTMQNDLLARVHEGMVVYDRDGEKVGPVKDVYLGEEADAPASGAGPTGGDGPLVPGEASIVSAMSHAFGDNLPEVLRKRLRQNGFVRIGGGLLRGDRFALREYVAGVEGERVSLKVGRNELIDA